MYPNAYGADCGSSSTQPYGMPNFGSLAKDPLLPQRCQDPTQMQVSDLTLVHPGCFAQPSLTVNFAQPHISLKNQCAQTHAPAPWRDNEDDFVVDQVLRWVCSWQECFAQALPVGKQGLMPCQGP